MLLNLAELRHVLTKEKRSLLRAKRLKKPTQRHEEKVQVKRITPWKGNEDYRKRENFEDEERDENTITGIYKDIIPLPFDVSDDVSVDNPYVFDNINYISSKF